MNNDSLKKLFVVISEFHGDFDSFSILGIYDDEEKAKQVTKEIYLKELGKRCNIRISSYDKELNEGIFYDEDNDMHLFKYQIHYLNTDNESLLN